MKSKRTIIIETALYYHTDPSRRATTDDAFPGCRYVTDDGRRCAVGRCTTLEADKSTLGQALPYLKPEYKGHSDSFWVDLQRLHDMHEYWNSCGLSTTGAKRLKRMLEIYK